MEPELLEQSPEITAEPTTEPTVEAISEPTSEPALAPQDITGRLATDFLTLAEEFPHISSPSQLPDGVLELAAEQGIPLLDAYLRHRWQEEKKVARSTKQRRQAAQSSAGSLSRGSAQTPPEQDAFLRAFHSAL